MQKIFRTLACSAAVLGALAAGSAHAALNTFQTYNGTLAVSTDGWGSTTQVGTISAFVPAGATVVGAYLYTSTYGTTIGAGGTLNGTTVNYSTALGNTGGGNNLQALRADVTSIVKPLIDVGLGGTYNFRITETSAFQDGSALVVVYSLPTLQQTTIAILDGFSTSTGDVTSVTLPGAINTASPNFRAELRLGIGYSADGSPCGNVSPAFTQVSTVAVNGTQVSANAGCSDDNADAAPADGNLITVGGSDDPFSPTNPSIADDHERYNLVPYLANGATSVSLRTTTPQGNDNVFLAVLSVTPGGGVPEPATLALTGLSLAALGMQRRRKQRLG